MAKKSNLYLDINPYKIIETGFHKNRAKVSESIFSLGNEYCGIRGFFEEGYSGESLVGSYFNGIYEYALEDTINAYKGIVKRTHFTINSTNYFKCQLVVDGERLDLNKSNFSAFKRELDLLSGEYVRYFIWHVKDKNIKITFKRLLNMVFCHEAIQEIGLCCDKDVTIKISFSLDGNAIQWGKDCYFKRDKEFNIGNYYGLSINTLTTSQKIVSLMDVNLSNGKCNCLDKEIIVSYDVNLKANKEEIIRRSVINIVDKDNSLSCDEMIEKAQVELTNLIKKGYSGVLENNKQFFNNVYENSDIEIAGDDKNQQGIRYCIFQLAQTYHGYAKDNNIGAKGLTGEAYSGHSFWDSETYCLPYYLFSNEEASKNLLMFRYNTLEEAKKRAIDLDCEGACYPIATRNGKEGCNLWQHASLQFQPSTGVVYAIYHYMNLYNDHEFFQNYGLEMVVEVCKFLLSRGDYNQDHTKFSFYNVMGPDEFQMMVNHNVYTNYMAKKTFDYLLKIINDKEYDVNKVLNKCGFTNNHLEKMIDASEKMVILYDDETKLFEQNAGFFDLPHIEVDKIPTSDFPLYSHWSYDRIYRNDMIKQPDVLMFMFLFNQDFTLEQKKANYEYYEPRCIHESSLSPSIHSIFASEIGKIDEAYKFFEFATRLDLDDYNCNTCEGIHTTSIAAAWMNIVYGFGGLRSDREELVLNPVIVDKWDYYSFKIKYHGSVIKVKVGKKQLCIKVSSPVKLKIYGDDYTIKEELTLELN